MAEMDKTKTSKRKGLRAKPSQIFLQHGSLAVRTNPKKSWKEKYMDLNEENGRLRDKLKSYEDERNRCTRISREHEAHLVNSGSCENVQVGNHNNMQVVNKFDAKVLEQLLERYDTKLEEGTEHRESMQRQIEESACKIKELEKLQERIDTQPDCMKLFDHHVGQLTENEAACPVTSVAKICKETTEMMIKTVVPGIARLHETITSLQISIDDPITEFLSTPSLPERYASTISLNERKQTAQHIKCHRRVISELSINTHV